ncbi:hypothetical protein D918_05375 [Trichuris suis]|nr:hypothetical protein D918_05375 [Trichuris suis]
MVRHNSSKKNVQFRRQQTVFHSGDESLLINQVLGLDKMLPVIMTIVTLDGHANVQR